MGTQIETIIIGGGQAGLAVSYYLKRQGRPHLVFECAGQAGNAWRNHRRDSFTLNTPNWQSTLPGAEVPGNNPDGFLLREEIVAYFERYVERFDLPVRYGVHVERVLPKVMAGCVRKRCSAALRKLKCSATARNTVRRKFSSCAIGDHPQ